MSGRDNHGRALGSSLYRQLLLGLGRSSVRGQLHKSDETKRCELAVSWSRSDQFVVASLND